MIFQAPTPATFFVDDVTISGPKSTASIAALNPKFDPPYISVGQSGSIQGPIAQYWQDNSAWANVQVSYFRDTSSPHSSGASQGVKVLSVVSGAVQLVQPILVVPGQQYTMKAWLRGSVGFTVNLILQSSNPPYSVYGSSAATLTSAWQLFSVSCSIGSTTQLALIFQATAAGTFSVDDVTFTAPKGTSVFAGVPWPTTPFGTLRLWGVGTEWSILEPQKGVWNFAPLDTWVAAAQANNVKDIIRTLGQTPVWASPKPSQVDLFGAGSSAPPSNMSDWINYVRTIANRYKGRIRYFEIWNEPNDFEFYSGTLNQLVWLTGNASQIIKAVDPGNTVISPPPYSVGYLDLLLKAGIGPYVDVIGYHVYATKQPEDAARQLYNVRLVMAARGLSAKPLWDTEGASGDESTSSPLASAFVARKFLVDLAFGSGRFIWFTWGRGRSFCVGMTQNDRTLTDAGKAYGYVYSWLSNSTLVNASIDSAGNWMIFLKLVRGKSGLVVWNPDSTVQFTVPHSIQVDTVRDLFGGSTSLTGNTLQVNGSPILIVGKN